MIEARVGTLRAEVIRKFKERTTVTNEVAGQNTTT